MNQEKMGNFIAKCRKENQLTQEDLAETLGVSSKSVSRWENGRNMPDISLMPLLCSTLNISLNELFAAKRLKENQIKKQAEKNIFAILKFDNNKYKKHKIIEISIIILLVITMIPLGRLLFIKWGYIIDNNLKYTQVYISNDGNIKGNVDINKFGKISIDFDIGANKYGYAVFKNPKKAFKTFKKKYAKGIKLIQQEFDLLPLNNFTYKEYKTYGYQVTMGTDEERREARFVSSFLDIYENSFN